MAAPEGKAAWWLDVHGESVEVPAGATTQLSISAGEVGAALITRKAPPALAMTFDGLGTVGSTTARICTPTKESPFPQERHDGDVCNAASAVERSAAAFLRRSPTKSHSEDRQHPQDSTMLVALSKWRAMGNERAERRARDAAGGTEAPLHDSFDADSLHHPEGHWHQVKKEGLLSHALVTRNVGPALSKQPSITLGSRVSSIPLAGGAGVIEDERTLAETHDHGRVSHPKHAKHFGQKGDPDDHLHGRSHRPMPWEPQAATVKTHIGRAASAPLNREEHHQKLLRGRKKVKPSDREAATSTMMRSNNTVPSDPGMMSPIDRGVDDGEVSVSSMISQSSTLPGDSLLPGRHTPRCAPCPASRWCCGSPCLSCEVNVGVLGLGA